MGYLRQEGWLEASPPGLSGRLARREGDVPVEPNARDDRAAWFPVLTVRERPRHSAGSGELMEIQVGIHVPKDLRCDPHNVRPRTRSVSSSVRHLSPR